MTQLDWEIFAPDIDVWTKMFCVGEPPGIAMGYRMLRRVQAFSPTPYVCTDTLEHERRPNGTVVLIAHRWFVQGRPGASHVAATLIGQHYERGEICKSWYFWPCYQRGGF